ncbi:MAG TPA: prepilin-type N-terminal cleavage/methylation domain-containing protein [Candidatus Limnocylindrales bacterium]|nr:prepilin-type N-terminal cleavage/methylation domain-containing protein [Candidatus Limnocylindrales bacterium]
MKCKRRTSSASIHGLQAGVTLIETMMAVAIILICAAGVMGLASVAISTTENQGHLMARTAEYAQDKMEQLLALAYCDATTDTTQIPSQPSGGTGLAGCPLPLASPATGTGIGGSSDPANPIAGYADYLDSSGKLVPSIGGAAPATWFYIRVWKLSAGPNGVTQMKQITVTTQVFQQVGAGGTIPQTAVVALKGYPF